MIYLHVMNRGAWGCEVPSIGCDACAVVIGRAPRSQPRTNLLLAQIAKSLRQRHFLHKFDLPFCVVDRDRRSQPLGRS
jgi:hypothetical protein